MKKALFLIACVLLVGAGLLTPGCFFPDDVTAPPTPPPGDGTCNPGELKAVANPVTIAETDVPEGLQNIDLSRVPSLIDLGQVPIEKSTSHRTGNVITITVTLAPQAGGRTR